VNATLDRATVSGSRVVLYVEDDPRAREPVEETVARFDLAFVAIASTAEAWAILEDEGFSFGLAFLDQRLPRDPDGDRWADEEEVDELAKCLAERGPIVWVTAHGVDARRLDLENCLGAVQKADDVSGLVEFYLAETIGDLKSEIMLDEMLIEISDLRPETVDARAPTWKPDQVFKLKTRRLEPWIITVLRESEGKAYFRVRGWLGAERPGQLDLTDWHYIPHSVAADESFWDDDE